MREFVRSLLDSPRDLLFPVIHVLTVFLLGLGILKLIDNLLKRISAIVPTDATHLHRINHRTETLRHFVRSLGRTILGTGLVIMVAAELGYPNFLSTLVATAGIAGLAIGFGAQSLVKDVISGFFVLFGDQYGVGESVRIGTLEGIVEEMTLRITTLRSADGEIHVIPNGSVQTVTVLSRDWRRALVDVEVSPKEELGRVFGVLAGVNDTLSKSLGEAIIDKPAIIGIEKLTGNGITVRLAAKTYPERQGEVVLEWRMRIKETFDREGIQLAENPRAATTVLRLDRSELKSEF
jgi:moderate conductance mechanosensitive channel